MGGHAGRLGAQIVSRGKGHSAVSKAAYNARTALENERLGTRDDYSRKHADCLFSGIYAPAKSPEWMHNREQLWNHVEAFEKRKDAQLARELLIDLPHELTAEQSRWFMQDFIKENFTRKGLVADLAIHAPHSHSDERNIHAHLLIVLRKLDGTEFAASKTRQTYAENVAELDGWKRSLEQHANKALTRHGHEARWDLRSNEARGVDREPEIHLGKAAAALERQGIETAPGNVNRGIRERNRQREAANENDRGEWVREQIAEAEASTLPELEAVQHDRDRAAAEARAELEAEAMPQHRKARPVIDGPEFVFVLDAMREREARERGDGSDLQARHAIEDLARTDPHGTARHFGHHAGDRLKSAEEIRREGDAVMRGGRTADELAAGWSAAKSRQITISEADRKQVATVEPARPPVEIRLERSRLLELISAGWERLSSLAGRLEQAFAAVFQRQQIPAQDPAQIPPPIHLVAQSGDQVNTPAPEPVRESSFLARLRAQGITPMADLQAAQEAIREQRLGQGPVLAGTRVAGPSSEATQRPSYEVEKAAEPVKTPEIERRGLFGRFRRRDQETPQAEAKPELAADRQRDRDAGDDRQEQHVTTPAETPAREPEPPRPAERLARNIAAEMVAEGRAAREAKRARETPEERADREAREAQADLTRGRGDGGRHRTRHHHSLLWELFHPFHDHRRRDHHRRPKQ